MTGPTLASLISQVISLVNLLIPLLAGIALVTFFLGIIRYIWAAGDSHAKANGREIIIWGLVALFVIFSIWGIINLACDSLLGTGACSGWSGGDSGGTLPAYW